MTHSTGSARPLGPVLGVRVVVPDLSAALAIYSDGLGWRVRAEGVAQACETGDSGALNWLGRPAAWLEPGRESALGGVCLVEARGVEPLRPLLTAGWSALELAVADVEAATATAIAAGFTPLMPPVVLGGGSFPLVASQLAGPGGEGVYLTQINGELDGFELPERPVEGVDGVFIAVLGASSLEESRAELESAFAVRRVSDRSLPVKVVNRQWGLPEASMHRISSLQLRGSTCIEVDQLPLGAAIRGGGASPLAAGIVSVAVRSGATPGVVRLPDGALLELCGSGTWAPVAPNAS